MGASRAPDASPRYKWYVVGMLWWCGFFNYADRQAIFSVFPLLEKELNLTPVQLGWLGSSFALLYGVAAPFAGLVIDRVRRKTAVLAGLHLWSLICMATASARSFPQLLFWRAAEGLGETFYFPASMSMISDYHSGRTRSRAMGLHQTSVYIGTIAGGFFGGLVGQRYGWRWSFLVFGGLGVLLGFVLQRCLREPQRGAADQAEAPGLPASAALRAVWTTPAVLLLMGAFLLNNFVAMVLLSWMPKFLYDKFQMNLALAGLTATFFVQVASMTGAPLGGWLADAVRRRMDGGRMLVQGCAVLAGAPFVVLCGQTTSVLWLIVALTAWGLFKGIYDANIFAAVFDFIPVGARGTAVGFMNFIGWLLGAGAAPVVIGYIAQRESLGLAISLASGAYVASGLLLLLGALVFARRSALVDPGSPA